MTSTTRQQGRVKFCDADKGYGFLLPLDGGADLFFHLSDLAPTRDTHNATLYTGEYVEYDVAPSDTRDGNKAGNITGLQLGPLMCEGGTITFSHYTRRQFSAKPPAPSQVVIDP